MGLLFSKNLPKITNKINKCVICDENIENDSFIICKITNNYFHHTCLTNNNSHLESCKECKKMYLYMDIINKLLLTEQSS
jgi:hypothetical protein